MSFGRVALLGRTLVQRLRGLQGGAELAEGVAGIEEVGGAALGLGALGSHEGELSDACEMGGGVNDSSAENGGVGVRGHRSGDDYTPRP